MDNFEQIAAQFVKDMQEPAASYELAEGGFWVVLGENRELVEVGPFLKLYPGTRDKGFPNPELEYLRGRPMTVSEIRAKKKHFGTLASRVPDSIQGHPHALRVDNDPDGGVPWQRAVGFVRGDLLPLYYGTDNPHPEYLRQKRVLERVQNKDYPLPKKHLVSWGKVGDLLSLLSPWELLAYLTGDKYSNPFGGFAIVFILSICAAVFNSAVFIVAMLAWFFLGMILVLSTAVSMHFIYPRYLELRRKRGLRGYYSVENDGLIHFANEAQEPEMWHPWELDILRDGPVGVDGCFSSASAPFTDVSMRAVMVARDEDPGAIIIPSFGFASTGPEAAASPRMREDRA